MKLPIRDSLEVLNLTILTLVTLGLVFTMFQWRAFRGLQETIEDRHRIEVETECDYCQAQEAANWEAAQVKCRGRVAHLESLVESNRQTIQKIDEALSHQYEIVDCCWDALAKEVSTEMVASSKRRCWKTVYRKEQ